MSKKLKFITETLKLADLVFSTKFQARDKINTEAKNDYADLAKDAKDKGADVPLPNLKAIRRGGEILVFSGFTRGAAYKVAEITEVKVDVATDESITDGDIFRMSSEANLTHGARLTNEDKKHNLLKFLKYPEYVALANTALAPYVGASEGFVRKHRPKHLTPDYVETTRSGKKVTIKKGKTGSKTGKKAAAAAAAPAPAAAGPEMAALDGIVGTTGAAPAAGAQTPPPAPKTSEADAALDRISGLLTASGVYDGAKFKEAVNIGTLPLSNPDIKEWSASSDKRVVAIALLVIVNRWSPKKAYAFIDKEVSSKTSVEHLINLSLASGKGYVTGQGNVFERVVDAKAADNKSYLVSVFDMSKVSIVKDDKTGTITIAPK